MLTQNKRLTALALTVAILLSIPLIAMQFTSEVDWGLFDFTVMGTLLLSAGLLAELVIRKVKTTDYRIALIFVLLVAFLLVWAELAAGIFGSPFAGS